MLGVLEHVRRGGLLDPFWMGKVSEAHLPVIEELQARGLLKPPPVRPAFLSQPGAEARLASARSGLSPIDLVSGIGAIMRIAFFVNSIEGEHPRYTTTALALAALTRGHDICYLTPGDFVLRPDDSLLVRARTLPGTAYKKVETLLPGAAGRRGRDRDDRCPRDRRADAAERSLAGCRRAALGGKRRSHVRPAGGRPRRAGAERSRRPRPRPEQALPPGFPQAVRPASLISKSIDEIRAFIDEQPGGVILKPLQGSGGKNVFKIGSSGDSNLNQIFEAVSGEGYLVAQSYIPEAVAGDVRLFLMNGVPLRARRQATPPCGGSLQRGNIVRICTPAAPRRR